MKPRHKRLALIFGAVVVLGVAVALVLNAFRSNLVFFYTPTQIVRGEAPKDRAFRIGGLVKTGSLQRHDLVAHFIVTDTVNEIAVSYRGILPDLFKEGRGVVAEGNLGNGQFVATEVLAKHDENYMPPEARAAVEQAQKTARTLQK
ncbi:cytochrome c maturation protein CcmE [Ferrovum myxofaciens]|jgi:cytochrome c-type biogenesis protein CcmE|uniref:Cytochrome c-type biogenesis protein CcmE n=2 Tax=root TaxID=1 RepID=A0A8F3DXK7_9PROT|nr:cytochrome c maturation protein CcmE [Ferrovum myxofaciens]KXW57743.1 cytochrome c-type biogenesis protein CcmE [Ferrovum myxofaciens]MBU6995559.1 cytochrome c maturation protein CcmE [Ferrovum myxofaciens]QKE39324.1 MAG: cytochrome c maturation protein CcmE [Ferrovum myxofaciens]QKE41877.1 MAG: cytochrome c maturation protein CcmE [Ferrovum myxofaciens]QWY74591.1 MAG: cytochrome c maturation protein CcmE [Ferrovum myxofaciens]